jgi:hypothetical protein
MKKIKWIMLSFSFLMLTLQLAFASEISLLQNATNGTIRGVTVTNRTSDDYTLYEKPHPSSMDWMSLYLSPAGGPQDVYYFSYSYPAYYGIDLHIVRKKDNLDVYLGTRSNGGVVINLDDQGNPVVTFTN